MKKISNKIITLALTVALIIRVAIGLATTYLLNQKQETDQEQIEIMLYQNFDQLIKYEVETTERKLLKIDILNFIKNIPLN